MDIEPPKSFVDPTQSFAQNLVRLAKESHVLISHVANSLRVNSENLRPSILKRNPNPSHKIITIKQAEAAINIVAPQLADKLRKLAGYPEIPADDFMHDFVNRNPGNKKLQLLKGINFGPAFRLYRSQVPVSGTMLKLEDCVVPEASLSTVSIMERDLSSEGISTAFKLIAKFGFEPNKKGLESFCRKAADVLNAYLIRQREFGRALFIHLYPDGKTRICYRLVKRQVTPEMIWSEINSSPKRIGDFCRGKDTPSAEEAAKICALFGYASERDFYRSAREKYRKRPDITPPVYKGSEETTRFGRMVRLVREEIGITQTTYARLLAKTTNLDIIGKTQASVNYIERGQHRLPLTLESKSFFIEPLGFDNTYSFGRRAEEIELLRGFRDRNFSRALKTIAAAGNEIANVIYSKKHDYSFTPVQIRNTMRMLKMTESELYEAASIAMDKATLSALDSVIRFITQPGLKRLEKNESVGRREGTRGRLPDFASIVNSPNNLGCGRRI